jgi:hypothetical protein
LKVRWEECFPRKRHPLLGKCPSFGRYYTSAGYDEAVGCSIRFNKPCRAGPEVERECEKISNLPFDQRRRLGV